MRQEHRIVAGIDLEFREPPRIEFIAQLCGLRRVADRVFDGNNALVRREFLTVDDEPRSPGRGQLSFVQELVRVNHLANCLLCHAPSFQRGDLVRGAVPTPGLPLPAQTARVGTPGFSAWPSTLT